MKNLRIRRLTANDLIEITALERSCQPDPWSLELFRRELENPIARFDLAERDGRIVGYLSCWQICDELEIHNIVTAPEQRRLGVAMQLLQAVLSDVTVDRAFLEVRCGNQGAIALYRKLGFVLSGHREDYYHDGEDALLMTWHAPTQTPEPDTAQE